MADHAFDAWGDRQARGAGPRLWNQVRASGGSRFGGPEMRLQSPNRPTFEILAGWVCNPPRKGFKGRNPTCGLFSRSYALKAASRS
jgi:hypothetical protein